MICVGGKNKQTSDIGSL